MSKQRNIGTYYRSTSCLNIIELTNIPVNAVKAEQSVSTQQGFIYHLQILPGLKAPLSCLGRMETKNLLSPTKNPLSHIPFCSSHACPPLGEQVLPKSFSIPCPLFHRHLLILSMYYILAIELKKDPLSSRDLQSNEGADYVSIS